MNRSVFRFPSPLQPLQFDGERYTSGVEGPIQREHYHRYLFALRYCTDKYVLDVASGEGYGSFLLGQAARSVIGVDIDQKAVDFANENYMSERVSYRQGSAVKLPIEDKSVDVVVSFETVEHFADQGEFVSEIDRVLRPDGLVIMSSPNREIYSEAQNYQNPFHVHEMNKQEFVHLLRLRFQHIRLLDQGAVHGSLIRPLPEEQADSVEGFTTRDGRIFEHLIGARGAPYFIAIAARAHVLTPPVSVLHADFYHEQIERRFAALDQVRQEQAAVHSQHAQALRAELAAYQKQAAVFARREEEIAARHAAEVEQIQSKKALIDAQRKLFDAQIERFQTVKDKLLPLFATLQEAEAKQNDEIAESVRRLALRRARPRQLPRKLRGVGPLFHKKKRRLADDYRLLASSPLFDGDWYLTKYPDVDAARVDPVLHYLERGAAEGRQPSPLFDALQYAIVNPDVAAAGMNPLLHFLKLGVHEARSLKQHIPLPVSALLAEAFRSDPKQEKDPGFDADFLGPYYLAAGQSDNPLLAWRKLSTMGAVPPATREAAEMVAAFIRQSPFFNAPFYGRRLPEDMDPAVHYAVIGEALGWAPSEAFDPQFYLARYSDLEAARVSPLRHFQETGKNEGRRGVPGVQRLTFAPLKDERQPVLVICHEATRTGAPILGWNLIRDLRKNHPVVTLLMRGGVLENDFATASDVVVGPLTDEEWHPAETVAIAERLIKTYQPLYAIANSIETSLMVPPLGALGVPSVALVHEFASYTRPLEKMQGVYDWATHVVFPAQIVANSAFQNFPAFAQRRGIHILAQGRQFPPATRHPASVKRPDIGDLMRSANEKDKFIVLGAGFVHLRKGVDLFLSVAALARRFAPDIRFKFIWVGDGYNPDEDASYSVYLREQISRSGLENIAVFLESVEDFESAYRAADAFFISSRLDPQPNVGIDALTLGLPTVCFAGACGTGEVLASDPETRPLVVPHLDVEAAAREICRVANDPDLRKAMARAVERVGRSAFNSEKYATQIDAWGREAAAALSRLDLETLRSSGAVEPEFALPPRTSLAKSTSVEQVVLLQSTVVGTSPNQYRNAYFRRAIPGFHAQAYAIAHLEDCGPGGQDPTAHWLRHGRPDGPWSHPVYSPKNRPTELRETPRVALHAHFYYADLAPEFAERLKKNRTPCDLFVSTDTEQKAEMLWLAFNEHRGRVTVRVMPNVGRDIGPLLTGFCEEIGSGRYDIWGHAHGKKSAWSNTGIGDRYRTFLWDNLIGGDYPMLDIAIAAFASDSKLGLVFAEDPHLVGWDGNRENAETLAERMGLSRELPEFFDFPLGQMFWFRPAALRRLFELGLKWDDYPKEPVPYDGTLVHALERIVPFVVTSESYGLASLRAPHTTW